MRHDNSHTEVREVVGKAVVFFARLCNDNFLAQISFNIFGCL